MTKRRVLPWRWAKPGSEVSLIDPVFPVFGRGITHLFDELTRELGGTSAPMTKDEKAFFNPRLDIAETEKAIEMNIELPGVDKKDIQLSLEDGVLTIQGEKNREEEKKDKNVYRRECVYGTFMRRIPLPAEIEVKKIEAVFEKGVLKITLPKTKAAEKEVHRIAVKAA